jgi:hypothetical protein
MAAGMTERDQYTLSAKTCNRGILQIDVQEPVFSGGSKPFSVRRWLSESCLQSTDPGRKVVPAILPTRFVLPSRKLSMRICPMALFHLSSAYLHRGAIPLSAGSRSARSAEGPLPLTL